MSGIRYRPDIDGLRAVAVLAVVFYHAFPSSLPGGFSGVDIFFVISGYLISGILFKAAAVGEFSFSDFYARRVRRLFPVLLTVLAGCLLYGHVVLTPTEFQELGKQAASWTLFLQNVVFWQESGYFETASALKPLLHLWSLAVEEQFYIVFPPLFLLAWRCRWPMTKLLSILLLASFGLNLVMSFQDPAPDFFLTPYRSWEFLAGALLAWKHHHGGHAWSGCQSLALSVSGTLLMLVGMAWIDHLDPYPGWRALFPVVGTVLVIGAGNANPLNARVFSHPAVVWIGLISYPLYLFHWPLISFLHIVKGTHPPTMLMAGALLASFVLAALSYHLLERMVRYRKGPLVMGLLLALFLSVGTVGFLSWKGVIPPRKVPDQVALIQFARCDRQMMRGYAADDRYRELSVYRAGGKGRLTLFLGDSHCQQYAPRILRLVGGNDSASRGVMFVTAHGVAPIPGVTLSRDSKYLMPLFRKVLGGNPEIDRVVIVARWEQYFGQDKHYRFRGELLRDERVREKALTEFGTMIRELVDSGKQVTVVLGAPTGQELDPGSTMARNFAGVFSPSASTLSREGFLKRSGALRSEIAAVSTANGASVIDPLDALCVDGMVPNSRYGEPVYYDHSHLRPGFVRDHVTFLDSVVEDGHEARP